MKYDQIHKDCFVPSLIMLFGSFLRMGITAFGGPAMIAYIRKMAVVQKQWIDGESFQDGVALCQVIPGATVMQMAAYIGLKARGVPGAMVSYIGFGLPAFLLMMALSALYSITHALPAVVSEFNGLQAVIVAVVANAAVSFSERHPSRAGKTCWLPASPRVCSGSWQIRCSSFFWRPYWGCC